jgi:threonyl-tRNA synthetase
VTAHDSKTARQILEERGKLAPEVVAARIDGEVIDLHTPVSGEAREVDAIRVDHPDALAIIRHSTSHVMAEAVQDLFPGTKVAFGPATDNGFYYDYDRPDGKFTDEDLRKIEARMAEIVAADHPFRREVLTADEARKLLADLGETYKLEHCERLLAQGEEISVYRHDNWVDLCEGPHVPSTRFLKAFQLTSVAGAYWRGDERNPMLQRIYGTAFPNEKALRAHLKQIEEAKQRDHRKLGKELELIAFDPLAPASPFFLPRGAKVYNALVDYIRDLYRETGYEEVITPQIFDTKLFWTSGHLPSYFENMYFGATPEDMESFAEAIVKASGELSADQIIQKLRDAIRYGVKPMNCPSHCVLFGMKRRSYRELPWRVADFGRLHRFERSGVVQGLTRVRTFAQDDAHIFCTEAQLPAEIGEFIDLVYRVYKDLAFSEVRIAVATRPAERIGSDEVWDRAEAALCAGVEAKGLPYQIAEGEGAFYGPKVEFHLKDALGRPWQLGTIQADFNMPERFELEYVGEDNTAHRPVMLHRAILGSVERFFGLLIEHVGGAFPTWLAPEQVAILTVSEKVDDYARAVEGRMRRAGLRVVTDLSNEKLGAKIRSARLMRIPYLAVVGEKEAEEDGLAIRSRDENKDLGMLKVDEVIARIRAESAPPSQRPV